MQIETIIFNSLIRFYIYLGKIQIAAFFFYKICPDWSAETDQICRGIFCKLFAGEFIARSAALMK